MPTKSVYERCLNPACGGYRVMDTPTRFNPKSGKPAWNPWVSGCLASVALLLLLSVLGAVIVQALVSLFNGSPADLTPSVSNVIAVIWLVAAAVIVTIIAVRYRRLPQEHHYRCSLCGFRWTWSEGTPPPSEPTYRPTGVTQAGADLNAQQAAAAAAYEQQRRRVQ